ncbi:MAG: biotin-dependent carboxyltransferase family protein [Pseudomonadota bacterium]
MTGVLRIIEPGLATTVQDRGRPGLQRFGVPPAGAVDGEGLALALALAGADGDAACGAAALECRVAGPVIEAEAAPVRVAFAGAEVAMRLNRSDGTAEPLGGWQSVTLMPGDRLAVGPLSGSITGYLAVAGGIMVDPVMGSRSTLTRAGIGGLDGRALAPGDRLLAGGLPMGPERGMAAPDDWLPARDTALNVHVVMGPQDDHVTPPSRASFLGAEWRVSARSDRMGLRLEGPVLSHETEAGRGADIVSDGIVTGAVQVPGSGQPILLLVDRQTSGGYAKIAAVISADLARLGRLGPGAAIRFTATDAVQGAARARAAAARLQALIDGIAPLKGGLDLAALYRENLITAPIDDL